jgi:hypothetical protein
MSKFHICSPQAQVILTLTTQSCLLLMCNAVCEALLKTPFTRQPSSLDVTASEHEVPLAVHCSGSLTAQHVKEALWSSRVHHSASCGKAQHGCCYLRLPPLLPPLPLPLPRPPLPAAGVKVSSRLPPAKTGCRGAPPAPAARTRDSRG